MEGLHRHNPKLADLAAHVVAAHESGELREAVEGGGMKAWIKGVGKATDRKGKRLFMPMRILLTGSTQGPDVGEQVAAIALAEKEGAVADGADFVTLDARMDALKAWAEAQPVAAEAAA